MGKWAGRISILITFSMALAATLYTFGVGTLSSYVRTCVHRMTSSMLLEGKLHLPARPTDLPGLHDLQIHNGALYSNWGYGIPLLQLPFHVAHSFTTGMQTYFPDRAIFGIYLALCLLLVTWAMHRWLAHLLPKVKPVYSIFIATLLLVSMLNFGLYWVMTLQFTKYEETICYFQIAQWAVLAFFAMYWLERKAVWIALAGAVAGFAILIRQTGWVHFAVWASLFVFLSRRKAISFFIPALPSILFWIGSGYHNTGRWFSSGQENTVPGRHVDNLSIHFGNVCKTSWEGYWEMLRSVASSLFLGKFDSPMLYRCRFFIDEQGLQVAPFLGLGVAVLLLALMGYFLRKRSPLYCWAPMVGIVLLVLGYAWGGAAGFVYRYAADFWPLIFLAVFLWIASGGIDGKGRWAAITVLLLLPVLNVLHYKNRVYGQRPTAELASEAGQFCPGVANNVGSDHWLAHLEPTKYECEPGKPPGIPFWLKDCSVRSTTSMMLGLPPKSGPHVLTLKTSDHVGHEILIYLNGNHYTARWENDQYRMEFKLDESKFITRNVYLSVRWFGEHLPPYQLRLFKVEIS